METPFTHETILFLALLQAITSFAGVGLAYRFLVLRSMAELQIPAHARFIGELQVHVQ